ncbi:MAG: HEAT repeat domain-containing protein [Candidatus Wallbacteria bacterium]|nr:HEAT repeat domain-containing protein [Candidatus Wallbacteria bacterium]
MDEIATQDRLAADLSSDLEEVRKFAVIGLTQSGGPEALALLERMTRDVSPAVRYFARVGMNKLRQDSPEPRGDWERVLDEAAADDVDLAGWRRLLTAPDPERRVAAAVATLKLVDPAIYVVLSERLAAETDPRPRATLVRALARFRRLDSFELLRRFLSDPDSRVRANAVEALQELQDPRLKSLLTPLLEDPDNRTRGNALLALAQFDRSRALAGAEAMAVAPEVWMRATAIWLLGQLAGDEAAKVLRHMLRRETGELTPKVRQALENLAAAGSKVASAALEGPAPEAAAPPVISELVQALASSSFRERIDAVGRAVQLSRDQALAVLRDRLAVEDHLFVIATLEKAIGSVGGPDEVGLVAGYLHHPDGRVRANAIEGLAATGLPSIYPLIEPLLTDPNNRVRANAARVMAAKDADRAFGTLKEMLLAPDPLLADSALFALKEIGTDHIREILEIGLQNKNQEIQLKVLKVLEVLGRTNKLARELHEKYRERGVSGRWTRDSLPVLLLRMNDSDPAIRLAALEKLAEFPDARARNRIKLALKDRDPHVRVRAEAIAAETDLEEKRRGLLSSLGLAAYKKMKEDAAFLPELAAYCDRIRQASQQLDRGEDVVDSISIRREQVHGLGERVFVLFQAGKVTDSDLKELCQAIFSVEVERDNRRMRVLDTPRPPFWDIVPPMAWGALALGALLMLAAWLLMPSGSGPVLWRKSKAPVARLTSAGDVLLAAQPGAKVVAYRKRNGSVFWEASPGRKEMHAPVAANDLVYVAGDGGTLIAYRQDTGERALSVQVPGQILARPEAAPDALFLLVSTPPAGTAVLLLDPHRGNLLRKDDLGAGDGQSLLLTAGAEVAVVGERLVAIERATGRKLWEYRADAPYLSNPGPASVGDRIVGVAGRSVMAVDSLGKLVWSQQLPEGDPPAAGPWVWGNQVGFIWNSRLHVLSADGGVPVASHELGPRISFPQVSGDRFLWSPERGAVAILWLQTGRSAILSGIDGDLHDLAADAESLFASTDKGLIALRIPESK